MWGLAAAAGGGGGGWAAWQRAHGCAAAITITGPPRREGRCSARCRPQLSSLQFGQDEVAAGLGRGPDGCLIHAHDLAGAQWSL